MRYLLVLTFFFSSLSFASPRDHWRQICFSENGMCAVVQVGVGGQTTIYLNDRDYSLAGDLTKAFAASGVYVSKMSAGFMNTMNTWGVPTVHVSYQQTRDVMISPMSPEAHAAIGEGSACVVGAGLCSISAFVIPETMGLSVLAMKVECAATGAACAMFIDTLSAWRQNRVQAQAKEKAAIDAAGSGEESSSGSTGGSPSVVIYPGGGSGTKPTVYTTDVY